LKDKKFDVVIDNPTTLPFCEERRAIPQGKHQHYIFISTTSVFRDESQVGINEDSPRCRCRPPRSISAGPAQHGAAGGVGNPEHGAFKARAEVEVQNQYAGINTIIRPCLIVGPLDNTDASRTGRHASTRAARCSRPTNRRTPAIHRLA
jgi:2'-hydroxyisoflavone reductase